LENRLINELRRNHYDANQIVHDNENLTIRVAELLYEPVRIDNILGERRFIKESLYNDYDIIRRIFPIKTPFIDDDITVYSLELHLLKPI
jgi:hypothetical protein